MQSLKDVFGELVISPIYETAAVGFEGDNFLNLVVSFDSDLTALDVFHKLRELEFKHGRLTNSQKYSPRCLDLDLLLYGDAIIDDGVVKLPRDDIEKFEFVLRPLADIAPQYVHPVLKKTYEMIMQRFLEQRN